MAQRQRQLGKLFRKLTRHYNTSFTPVPKYSQNTKSDVNKVIIIKVFKIKNFIFHNYKHNWNTEQKYVRFIVKTKILFKREHFIT